MSESEGEKEDFVDFVRVLRSDEPRNEPEGDSGEIACTQPGPPQCGRPAAETDPPLLPHELNFFADAGPRPWKRVQRHGGSMDLVRQTLAVLAAVSSEEGTQGLGKYAESVMLGRELWQTDPLQNSVAENIFDAAAFPEPVVMKKII